jgi:hypothetical protein
MKHLYKVEPGNFRWIADNDAEAFAALPKYSYRRATDEETYQFGRDEKAAEILESLTRERFVKL